VFRHPLIGDEPRGQPERGTILIVRVKNNRRRRSPAGSGGEEDQEVVGLGMYVQGIMAMREQGIDSKRLRLQQSGAFLSAEEAAMARRAQVTARLFPRMGERESGPGGLTREMHTAVDSGLRGGGALSGHEVYEAEFAPGVTDAGHVWGRWGHGGGPRG
jgi:hypothetical protein